MTEIKWLRVFSSDMDKKQQGNKGTAKKWRKPVPANIRTSGNLIIYGFRLRDCPLIYLQV